MKTTIRFTATESKIIREHKGRIHVIDLLRVPEEKRDESLSSYARETCTMHGIK